MEAADRDEAVRLRVEETLDGVREGIKLVLEVDVVEVEALRRLLVVFIECFCGGDEVADDVRFKCTGFRASAGEEKTEAVVMIACLLAVATEYPSSGTSRMGCCCGWGLVSGRGLLTIFLGGGKGLREAEPRKSTMAIVACQSNDAQNARWTIHDPTIYNPGIDGS